MLALVLLAHAIVLLALFARRRKTSQAASMWLVEGIPIAALTILFVWLSVTAERLWAQQRYVGADPSAMQVEAVGVQFQWYFRYPGADAAFGQTRPELVEPGAGNPLGLDPADAKGVDDLVTSELVLPAGREVDLRLRAHDVIHGLFIPSMRIKQNALPGQTLHIHFTPEAPGTYAILCSQLCGLGHYRMQATLRVVSEDDFMRWLSTHQPSTHQAPQ